MTRRESAINEALIRLGVEYIDNEEGSEILSDLIDQAEAGKLKEPLPRWYTGINGTKIVHPDGTREHRP